MNKNIALIFIFVTSFFGIYAQDVQIQLGLASGYNFTMINEEETYYQSAINTNIFTDLIVKDYFKARINLNYEHNFEEGPFGLTIIRASNNIGMNFLAGLNVPYKQEKFDFHFSLLAGGGFGYGFYSDNTRFFYPTANLRTEFLFQPLINEKKNLGLGFALPYYYYDNAEAGHHKLVCEFVLAYRVY